VAAPPSASELWSSAASGWDAGFDWYVRNLRPLSDWFCARLAAPGARVLDIACGTGLPALALAASVGPTGRVLATDAAPGMLTAVARRAREARLDNLAVREMDAQRLDVDDASFDAVSCSCGLMLFPDPLAAVAEMRRVLVPKGRVAVSVWAEPADNPFFTVPAAAVTAVFPPSGTDRKSEKGRSLGAPGELERVLSAGGLSDVGTERIGFNLEVTSVDEYWRLYTSFVPGLADKVAALPAVAQQRARAVLEEAAAPFRDGGLLRIPATAVCGSGEAPGLQAQI
jgi:SAM-dependent methyltransferase